MTEFRTAVQRIDEEQQKHIRKFAEAPAYENPSLYNFLLDFGLSWQEYVLSLRASVQKSTVFYKCALDAIRRNSFNPRLLSLQHSNTDAQFVLDPFSAATYISSYMMKTDLALSKLMKDACRSACAAEGNAGQVMRAIGNALLNGQEISIQHAVYVCTRLPFRGTSRETVFVPSSSPAHRTFLVKQDWELKCLPPDSTDCVALSIVDKYAFRKCNPHLQVHSRPYADRSDLQQCFTPVFRVSRNFQATSRQESMILQWQFPVRPATAATFHHNQGLTLQKGAVNFRGPKFFPKMAGRHYVGYSYFSRPEGHLFVLDSAFEETYVNPRVHTEMKRLRDFSRPSRIFSGLDQSSEFPSVFQCVLHNTRSLLTHIEVIRSDFNLLAANLLIFTEARIGFARQIPDLALPAFKYEYGEPSSALRPVNVAVYHKDHDSAFFRTTVSSLSCPDYTLKYDIFSLPHMSDRLHLISVYRSPHPASIQPFFQQLQSLLDLQKHLRLDSNSPLLICGNFNINLLQNCFKTQFEILLFHNHSLRQCVQVHTTDFVSLLDHV
jgi:hypothetical protein